MINEKTKLSLADLKSIDQDLLDIVIFKRVNEEDSDNSSDNGETYQYFQIKKKVYKYGGKDKYMIQLIDQTNLMTNDDLQLANQQLALINAAVSHDIRGPLNSIIGQNEGTRYNNKQLRELIDSIKNHPQL